MITDEEIARLIQECLYRGGVSDERGIEGSTPSALVCDAELFRRCADALSASRAERDEMREALQAIDENLAERELHGQGPFDAARDVIRALLEPRDAKS